MDNFCPCFVNYFINQYEISANLSKTIQLYLDKAFWYFIDAL
jgi:hypothetical protein